MPNILLTTPIYYVNDVPHFGHLYTNICADILKRHLGQSALLLTGTDEHGQKIEESALKRGKQPKEYADEISEKFKIVWEKFNINYDAFVRTTGKNHMLFVQESFKKMQENGDIYLGEYEGSYCISCETYYPKVDNNKCPDCGKELSSIKEESYFFRLSKYQDKLLSWLNDNEVIYPKQKTTEVLNFIESGLHDLSISRTSFKWGINIDNNHIVYVWLDALLSYISVLQKEGGDNLFSNILNVKLSDHDCSDIYTNPSHYFKSTQAFSFMHFVGKDILKFHAVYWPAFLMSLNLPLPSRIFTHGWWLKDGMKMSKSIGNVINPLDLLNEYSIDSIRFFMSRATFGEDGNFNDNQFVESINSALSDKWGNLVSRVIGMSKNYFSLRLHLDANKYSDESQVLNDINASKDILKKHIECMELHKYVEEIVKLIDKSNVKIAAHEPWKMYKLNRLEEVEKFLIIMSNIILKLNYFLAPILIEGSAKVYSAFNVTHEKVRECVEKNTIFNTLNVEEMSPLYPKLSAPFTPAIPPTTSSSIKVINEQIEIEDFKKLDIRVGEILSVETSSKHHDIFILQVSLGDSIKQIIGRWGNNYKASDLVNKKVLVLSNLRSKKVYGHISEGMILTVQNNECIELIFVPNFPLGVRLN